MSTQQEAVQLAKSLPPRLLRFFQKFPPPAILDSVSAANAAASTSSTRPSSDAPSEVEAPALTPALPSSYPRNLPPAAISSCAALPYHNPFLPRKSHLTGRWASPVFGLRQQADLVKLASQHGVVDLLPWTSKKPEYKEMRRIEGGLRVKGTGEGQKVKGKAWERTLKGRLEMRRKAMVDMPRLVQEWKQKGHGRGWKKWPSGKAKK